MHDIEYTIYFGLKIIASIYSHLSLQRIMYGVVGLQLFPPKLQEIFLKSALICYIIIVIIFIFIM